TGSVSLSAVADRNGGPAVGIDAIAGGAGLVGIGAAVAIGSVDNNVSASLGGTVTAGNDVTVAAAGHTHLAVQAFGASVGCGAVGANISRATKTTHVTSEVLGGAGITVTGSGDLLVSAASDGRVRSYAEGGAVGFYTGSGLDAKAQDFSTVIARSGS